MRIGRLARLAIPAVLVVLLILPMGCKQDTEKKETGKAGSGRKKAHTPQPDELTQDVIRTSQNTLDLRGKTVDEAVDATDAFLDTSMREGTDVVFILHGHGTGALRDAVRAYLEDSRYVSMSRSGSRGEGGDGITVAWIK